MSFIRWLICSSNQVKRIKDDIQANQNDKKSTEGSIIQNDSVQSIYFSTSPPAHEKPHKGEAKEFVFVNNLKNKDNDVITANKLILVNKIPEKEDSKNETNGIMINKLIKKQYKPSSRAQN